MDCLLLMSGFRDMCPSLGSHSAGAQDIKLDPGQAGFEALVLTDGQNP